MQKMGDGRVNASETHAEGYRRYYIPFIVAVATIIATAAIPITITIAIAIPITIAVAIVTITRLNNVNGSVIDMPRLHSLYTTLWTT